jgi:hypothetical protein
MREYSDFIRTAADIDVPLAPLTSDHVLPLARRTVREASAGILLASPAGSRQPVVSWWESASAVRW